MINKTAKAEVKGRRQLTQFSCVSASVTASLQALGKDLTEDQVNKVLGAEPLRGARWEEALAAIQYFGCRGTLVVPATLAMVKEQTDKGNPVIIAWNPEGRPWSHASVISDVTETEVTIMDPNCVDPNQFFKTVSHEDFYKKWMEPNGDKMMVRRPALFVELEVTEDGRPVRASSFLSVSDYNILLK